MCGFVFMHRPELEAGELHQRCEAALSRLVHRGPDDFGLETTPPWTIGHRRLAILDIEGSRQPMTDPSRRYWLAYNGEIYNFRDLRAELASQWEFRTHGDTEVLLAGLICHGADFLSRAEGMWAFALWDCTARRLLLGRDRMGKKPLYYHADGDSIACASELTALSRLTADRWCEDEDSTADYFRYGYYLPGTTAYRGIREVLPGHVLDFGPGEPCRSRPYWRLELRRPPATPLEAVRAVRNGLCAAVKRRLVADVDVGAFLSGGIDSSLVVGILSKEFGLAPKTFTIGFREASFDERPHARLVARHFGTDHQERCLDHWESGVLLDLILRHVGQPFADSSLLPTAEVSALAAEHVKVALSGDGSDELFSGYQRYQARALLRWYARLPAPLRCRTERLIRQLPEPMAHHSRSLLKKAHLFVDVVDRQHASGAYVAPSMYSAAEFALIAPSLCGRGHVPPGLPEQSRIDDVTEMMTADALIYLPQDILVKVDRATMAHSLEARAPFLDRTVVELALSMPRAWHRTGLTGKRLLRAAFADLLPASIWRRRKQGFAVPVHEWFRGGLGEELLGLIESIDMPLARAHVRSLLDAHREGRRDNGYRLWAIHVYLLWRAHGSLPV